MICCSSSDHDLSRFETNPSNMDQQPPSFKCFVQQNLGRSAFFFIYALLEFVMIILLLFDGLLTLFSYEFAKFFELKIPCFLCTRIDQSLVHRNLNFYYNDTICESHKRDISSLAYCHAHKKISDIKTMCESCLLSFASEKDSSDYFGEEDLKLPMKSANVLVDNNKIASLQRCSCCMEFLRKGKYARSASIVNGGALAAPSPRAWRNESLDSPRLHYTEVKLLPSNETEVPGDETVTNRVVVLDEIPEEACKTLSTARGNKFFGIPLSDSPRWSKRNLNMSIDFFSDPNNDLKASESEGGGIVQHLKRQVLLERKSLMALCMELDEERNASTIAANNAMAMITRLQAEKAAVQMQASQYQRMMEEQAEYDREEKQLLKDMIMKREEEIEALESELDTYRDRFGAIDFEFEGNEEFLSLKFQSLLSFGGISSRSLTTEDYHAPVHDEVFLDSDHSIAMRPILESNTDVAPDDDDRDFPPLPKHENDDRDDNDDDEQVCQENEDSSTPLQGHDDNVDDDHEEGYQEDESGT